MRTTRRNHTTNQTLRDMADDVLYWRGRGDSEDDILGTLFNCYQNHEVEAYLSLQNAYFATYAAYSLGEAEEVAAFITDAFAEDEGGCHFNISSRYRGRVSRSVRDHILDSFNRALRREGRRITNAIAGTVTIA